MSGFDGLGDRTFRAIVAVNERICVDAAIALAVQDGERGVSVPRRLVSHRYIADPLRYDVSLEEQEREHHG